MGVRQAILGQRHEVIEIDDTQVWAKMYDIPEARRVAFDKVGKHDISTVFLGLDHSYGSGPPLWFETMVFGPDDDETRRYTTWDEAVAGHEEAVTRLRNGETSPWGEEDD